MLKEVPEFGKRHPAQGLLIDGRLRKSPDFLKTKNARQKGFYRDDVQSINRQTKRKDNTQSLPSLHGSHPCFWRRKFATRVTLCSSEAVFSLRNLSTGNFKKVKDIVLRVLLEDVRIRSLRRECKRTSWQRCATAMKTTHSLPLLDCATLHQMRQINQVSRAISCHSKKRLIPSYFFFFFFWSCWFIFSTKTGFCDQHGSPLPIQDTDQRSKLHLSKVS